LEGEITDSTVRVARVLICANIHETPRDRYTIDPETFLHAEHAAQDRGRSIVGVWHSHPSGEPVPSATDRAEAWPGWSYLIAGVTNGAMIALRCWWLTEDGFSEQTVAAAGEPSANREIPDERT
ncbi:MAG: M67 family metallopeptidase, partial [Halofilum sp. (in: g-proteobacteria)]